MTPHDTQECAYYYLTDSLNIRRISLNLRNVPQPDRCVIRYHDHSLAVWAEPNAPHAPGADIDQLHHSPRCRRPHPDLAILRSSRQNLAILAECQAGHHAFEAGDGLHEFPRPDIPNLHEPI